MAQIIKIPSLKEFETVRSALSAGHRLCAGCAEPIVVRQVLDAARFAEPNGKPDLEHPYPVVVGTATGCLEVSTTPCPYTSWRVPLSHHAFGTAAAEMSGIVAAYTSQKKRGEIEEEREYRFVLFGGDGALYDIGFGALSGALSRMEPFLTVCLNNEAYMNTGIQKSGATPYGAWTTTTNAGKLEWRKDLTAIVAAHEIPYVAQAAPFVGKIRDLYEKVGRAVTCGGPAFINAFSPCTRGSRFAENQTIEIIRLAVESCYWPLYEVVEGKWILNYQPEQKLPIEEFLRSQGKFKMLLEDKEKVAYVQKRIDKEWETLLKRCNA